jgi:hypothetical protein
MPGPHSTTPSAQTAIAKKGAAIKASNAARMKAAALINTPGLTAGEAPSQALAQPGHDDQHVHGARAPAEERRASVVMRAPLRQWVRFRDLKRAGVVQNWTQLRRLIREQGFPCGRYAGANTRLWDAAEIEGWLDSRPFAAEHEQDAERAAELRGEVAS